MESARTDLAATAIAITAVLAVGLPLARHRAGVGIGEPAATRRRAVLWTAAGAAVWLAATGALAASGVLARWDRTPPPLLVLVAVATAAVVVLALTKPGRVLATGLPLWVLVGSQTFRLPVEWMLHRAYDQGVIGVQMTWSGRNFDVVTALTAVALAAWLRARGEQRVPVAVVWAWNALGFALLANIVGVAILSMPTRFRAFDGPPNAFVATFPFVWLPAVMVMAALLGHLLVARRLSASRRRFALRETRT